MLDFLIYSILALAIIVIVLIVWLTTLHNKIKALLAGKQGISLEKIITENHRDIVQLSQTQAKHKEHILNVQQSILKSIQGIGIVRFNSFKEMGGNQSFALALIDNKDDGIIISSLYTRDRVNVFAKPLSKGVSSITLSKEEKEALSIAQKN